MTLVLNPQDTKEAKKLANLVRTLNLTGHNPATSGNYSLRPSSTNEYALVSESGIDKGLFTEENLLPVNYKTKELHHTLQNTGRKSSDETEIHLAIYNSTSANCVLHSHILESLLFANLYPNQDTITLGQLELLKGFRGIKTHETEVYLPCFHNTQDITGLAPKVESVLKGREKIYGLMLRDHGIYVWGESVLEAKRHLEVFEYIFKYYLFSKGALR